MILHSLHIFVWQFKNVDGGLYYSRLKDFIKGSFAKKKNTLMKIVCNYEYRLSLFFILATNFLTE